MVTDCNLHLTPLHPQSPACSIIILCVPNCPPSPDPSSSLTAHASAHLQINYYFINSQGHPIEGLAVMHYITHL